MHGQKAEWMLVTSEDKLKKLESYFTSRAKSIIGGTLFNFVEYFENTNHYRAAETLETL